MHLYRVGNTAVVFNGTHWFPINRDWDELFNDPEIHSYLASETRNVTANEALAEKVQSPDVPMINQEVWAAGVTYFRSKTARMDESKDAGGGDFYDRVYDAPRPEIFFKATAARTVGPGAAMHLRDDSKWIVPEPELALAINCHGTIFGYTIGNDLSCRDIEGENPLYLPQAKTFDRCAAIGPAIFVSETPLPSETEIKLSILRGGQSIVEDKTSLAEMKRSLTELVGYLFSNNTHSNGCFLMTGTGIVPADDFCLQAGDEVHISIDPIGTLINVME
jgi:2-dehydro-3-deoxy-D-arabinonate dehydratase